MKKCPKVDRFFVFHLRHYCIRVWNVAANNHNNILCSLIPQEFRKKNSVKDSEFGIEKFESSNVQLIKKNKIK